MFKNLFHFAYIRTTQEAIGFYLAYLLFIIVVSMLTSSVLAMVINPVDGYAFGVRVGGITAVVMSTGLAFWILKEKKLFGNFTYVLIALLAGVLALLIGSIGGLIPVAYLTTRK